jgi:hypothetical protein
MLTDIAAISGGYGMSLTLKSIPPAGYTSVGSDVEVKPKDDTTGGHPVTLTFDDINQPGRTSLITSNVSPPSPIGFKLGDPPTNYWVTTTAKFSGLIEVCINYSEISFTGNEENLKLYHYEDTDGDGVADEWVDCTVSLDTGKKRICGIVTSFSTFAIFEPENQPPVANSGLDQTVWCAYNIGQGTTIDLDGTNSYDPDGDPLTYTWTGPFVESPVNGATPTVTLIPGCPEDYVITLVVNDGTEDSNPDDVVVTVQDPVTAVTYDGDTLLSTAGNPTVNANLIVSLRDISDNVLDIDNAKIACTLTAEGVGTILADATSQDGFVQMNTALEPAIYDIQMSLDCSDIVSKAILVVYNPEGGFATGGGWIVPEPDGLNTYPNVRANFGFNAKYKQDNPTGHLEFRYSDGHIDLKSYSIEQLVITGGKIVQFKGWASINGEDGHWFFVKAIDNGEPGINDTFEIKIWNPGSNIDGDYDELAGGVLQGGNILVHVKNK